MVELGEIGHLTLNAVEDGPLLALSGLIEDYLSPSRPITFQCDNLDSRT